MLVTFITLPLIAAFIGWITNYVAVKMLFHPRQAMHFLFFKIQGVFPKRQRALAQKLGEIVSTELFSVEDVRTKLLERASSEKLNPLLEQHIRTILREKLPSAVPMLGMFLSEQLLDSIQTVLLGGARELVSSVVLSLTDHIDDTLDVKKVVQERVENFSSEKLEQILYEIMKKEFTFIELIGGVLGFLIGLTQAFLAHYLG